uniref:Protein transport protein Sec24A n=1 Tax=Sipha flava TaxID=143950 RepID=A0A2S2Q3L3_9HEMI
MDHRFNYFHQNPNSLSNGVSPFNQPSVDGTQLTDNYSGSISSHDQSPFNERRNSNSNTVPSMNYHLYQMNSNEPPHLSGPPRTVSKEIYENSNSSIPDVIRLAQSNTENYPINPDFQLQPHLTGLLPQQSKKVSDLPQVDKYNTSKGSISANMNPNYFSSNKSYPEPKIIEYDMEETSTESSPRHTSSLYSESTTDQDSESIHPSNVFSKHVLSKNIECHVTKESKTVMSSNQEFPVPSQFADLSLNKDEVVDDHQHSILHSAYNQDDDIEDIPLSDNTNQDEKEHTLENHENLKFQLNEQVFDTSRVQMYDYHANKKYLNSTEFNNENNQVQTPSFNSNANSFKEFYLNNSNTLTQSNLPPCSISQPLKSLPVLPYDNTIPSQQKSASIQNFNADLQPTNYSQQNKHVQPVYQNFNVSLTNSNSQPSAINSNTQDEKACNQSTSSDQILNDQDSCKSMQSTINNLHYPQNVQIIESISQQSMYNTSKSSASEELNDSKLITNQQFSTYNPSLTSTQSVGLMTSSDIATPTEISLSSIPKKEEIPTSDEQNKCLFNSSNAVINNSTSSDNQDSKNMVQSELDDKTLQSSSNEVFENQQADVKSQVPTPIENCTQSNNYFNSTDTMFEQSSNYQQSSQNRFISQKSTFDDNTKSPLDLVSQTVNNQNATVQQSKPKTGHNTSHYFDSISANNKYVLNPQSHSQHENINTHNIKPVISSFSSSSKTNDFVEVSSSQNNAANFLSLNQQPSSIENKFEIADSLKLDSNVSLKETIELNSTKSIPLQSNNSHVNSFKSNDNIIPNDQFSNLTIENQQGQPVNQPTNQIQLTSTSYFSKQTSFNKREDVGELSNFSSSINDISNSSSKLSEVKNIPQSPLNNSSELDVKTTVQPIANPLPPQEFNNTFTENVISSATNQFSPQIFSNKPKLDAALPTKVISNPYSTQSVNNQQQSDTISSLQPISNPYSTQPITNQPTPIVVPTVSSPVTQFSPQMVSSQSKSENVSALQSSTNMFSTQPINNQQIPNAVPPVTQFLPQTYNDQPKPVVMPSSLQNTSNHYFSVNNQPTLQCTSSAINQFPPQKFNDQAKLGITAYPQPASSQYSTQLFSNPPSINSVSPKLLTGNQLPPQMFSNQSKPDISPLQTTNKYSSQPFNNQLRSNMVPPIPTTVNQLPPQMLNNQPKSQVIPSLQSSQPRMSMITSASSTPNQFPQQMISNQPGLDTGLLNKTTNRYPSQSLNKQPILGVQPIQQSITQYPPQPFNNQSKGNIFPPYQTITNQYPSQPFPSNQMYTNTNSAQPANSQWPPHPNINQSSLQLTTPISHQTNSMLSQPPMNLSSNLPSIPPSINQQSQKLGSQVYPSNLPSNNYYNQSQGNINVQQSQPPTLLQGQNVQLPSKGYPLQSNMGLSSQINYQQPNTNLGQQGFLNQQQDPYKTEQNSTTVQQGFAKTWGYDNLDLLKSRDVLPGDGVQPPEIKLPQGYANCDNCSQDIFRCTMNKFPSSKTLLDKSRLPLGILIHPYKDLSRLTVIQCETITRCRNCRSYINPFVQFIDNAHWKCNLCYRVNELPAEFQIDPYTKTLGDPSRRPEIQNATIEYIASQDYMVRPPQPALYLFLLDVSRTATLTGYLEIVCDRILNKIMSNDIPGDSRTNIGFITYDSSVHFYQISNSDGGQPKQLIVSDITDIFLPLPEGLMVNLEENKSAIKDLLTSLPSLYKESYNTGCALGAALQAAFKLLAPRGGRVTVFQACLPNCGPGNLQPRDDGKPHTGDRVVHMDPSTDFYKKLALECSAEQIAVDMFFVSSQYLDIATISGISKYSAGCIHNFSQFDVKSPTLVTRFINCFDRYLSRKIGFEALLRLRCTRGVAIHSFHGNFFVRSSDLLMLPNVNPDNAYGMQLSIEENLDGVHVVCFQAALLYTSSNAERRIRVHTLCIPVTDNLNDVFHNADQQAITCLIAKMAVDRSTEKSLSDAREAFFNAISDSLSAFKLGCSSYSGPGTMLSPLSLRVFPLYILATLKHAAFRTNQPTRLDERMFSMCQMKSLPLNSLIQYIYPDLYPIHNLEEQPKVNYEKLTEVPLPPVIQLSAERVESNGVYLMDDSETLTIFIGHRCSDQLIQKLFGYVNFNSMPELITSLTEVDSKPSYLLHSFVSYLQTFKPYSLPIEIIKDNGPHKLRFYSRLVEDKFESSLSYYEFLQRLSQQVK